MNAALARYDGVQGMSLFLPEPATATAAAGSMIRWEQPPCLMCGGTDGVRVIEAPDYLGTGPVRWFGVVQCKECHLCFTSPRPTIESMGEFYPPTYFPDRAPSPSERHRRGARRSRQWPWTRTRRKVFPVYGGGRLLDFGCGGGSYLARMACQGWEVTGVDVSVAAVSHIRRELGLRALAGTLPHPDLESELFEAITMWHSLEHVHEPLEVLCEAYRLLVPGGRLIVAAPNIEGLAFRWFGRCWYGLDLPRHLSHFSPRTLREILCRAGFRVRRVLMVRQTPWLQCSARLARRLDGSRARRQWLTSKGAARLAAWYSCVTRRSDCIQVTADKPA
jgi:SAM-dependent methyltransferase